MRGQGGGGLVAMVLAVSMGLAGCGSARPAGPGASRVSQGPVSGTVSGRLVLMGGPLGPGGQQPVTRPIPGTVRFTDGQHRAVRVRVGRSGRFSVGLPAGTYAASGQSPRVVEVEGGTVRRAPCTQPRRVTVTAGHTTHVTLACVVP